MHRILIRLVAIAGLAAAALMTPAAYAQAEPCSQETGPTGCIDVSLLPAGLSGDIYLDGGLVIPQTAGTRLHVAPGAAHTLEVRNVTDTAPGFGGLYVYGDASQANVSAAVGQTRLVTFRPRIQYVKGYLNFTCDIRGRDAAQAIGCQPFVDGAPLDPVAPGQTARFAILNGAHTIHVDLAGSDAGLWAPAASDHSVNIAGNRNTYLRATFNRKGRLTVNYNVPGVSGDVYLNDGLVAGQTISITLYVAPGNHAVAGRNLVDPAANGVYRYADVSTNTYVGPNQARTVTLRPRREFLVGFGQITCRLTGWAGQDARCNVAVDGIGLGTVEPGQSQTFNLAPGPHTVNVGVTGGAAGLWAPPFQTQALTIGAGRTSRLTSSFNRAPAVPTPAAPVSNTGFLVVVMCQGLETTLTVFSNGAIIRQESLHNQGVNVYELPTGRYDLQFQTVGYYDLNVAADIAPGESFTWYIGDDSC